MCMHERVGGRDCETDREREKRLSRNYSRCYYWDNGEFRFRFINIFSFLTGPPRRSLIDSVHQNKNAEKNRETDNFVRTYLRIPRW
jgi:hypothetical protein